MRDADGWDALSRVQRESLEMIQCKIGRILTGNPNLRDHYIDIAGYARLAAERVPVDERAPYVDHYRPGDVSEKGPAFYTVSEAAKIIGRTELAILDASMRGDLAIFDHEGMRIVMSRALFDVFPRRK